MRGSKETRVRRERREERREKREERREKREQRGEKREDSRHNHDQDERAEGCKGSVPA
ncbi:MAG: hypothetical protein VXZ35_01955 [Pseudomonadota bacterium]|nr:hypothetical protein [Pseudomonadota bacterium]